MPAFTDQLGRTITLSRIPRRIISLVPSQTELLYHLGLGDAVVGITKFCIHPDAWFHSKPRVGGTKAVDPARVDALAPDLIIANKEENDRPQIEALARRYPVWISDVRTLAGALDMIRAIGRLTDTSAAADPMADAISKEFATLASSASPLSAAYFIWPPKGFPFRTRRKDPDASVRHIPAESTRASGPWMVAGGDTFIHDMLRYCGFSNFFAGRARYPEIHLPDLAGPPPPIILLSSEPYPFRQRHAEEVREILPDAIVHLVDGEYFSWYGSRLLCAPTYFRHLVALIQR